MSRGKNFARHTLPRRVANRGVIMRRIEFKRSLGLGVALAGIWIPQAQAQAQSTKPDAAETVSTNDIIVTARRKEETLQDVPMTVTAVTDQKLKDLNLFNGSDLTAVVPGLTFSARTPGTTPVLALRGAARGEAGGRLDPTVQTYLNEAPVSDVMVYQALYDIGQVEVLRGPQGTLRGRPSSSGAITFTTKRPDLSRITGYVSLAASTLNQLRGEGAISVPIVEGKLAVRLAGILDRNENDGIRSLFLGRKPYQELNSWRASVRFQPVEELDINILYQDFSSKRGTLYQVAGTGYRGPSTPVNPVAQRLAANFNGPAISAFDRLSVSDSMAVREEYHQNLIGQVSLDLGTHRIVYVGEYNKTRNINSGGTNTGHFYPIPQPDPEPRQLDGRSELVTQELRFETTGATFWDYGVGLYYERTKSENIVDARVFFLAGTYGNPRAPSLNAFNYNYSLTLKGVFPVSWENKAIYANSTFHITPKTDLFVGARYVDYTQSSDQTGTLTQGLSATGAPVAQCAFIPQQGAGPAFASTFIPGQCDLPIAGRTLYTSNPIVGKEHAWVYNASLTHRFTDDITAYASFGHSWRPSTNNLNLQSTDPRITQFAVTKSETSNNFEAGLKMSFLDRKLSVNLAGFYQDYKGFLFSSIGVPYINNTGTALAVATATSLSTNADGKVKGFDIELAYRPSRQFSISGNLNYARGRLSNALVPCNDSNGDGIADSGVATVASFGTEAVRYCRSSAALAYQSDWNASMQAEYNAPVSSYTDGYIRTLVSYTPKNDFAPGPSGFSTEGYGLINLFLGLRSHDGKWDIGAYARNLTNVQKLVAQGVSEIATPSEAQSATALGVASSTGYRSVALTPRREFGATFRFNW
ncbi:TonB-dependent receptor [Sphingomonas sp. SUN039]|uniref:TonB-dependent receptor n=1 Tax=Sphingomonas sp. SUN039 TaxID=2937787 RepID=UPI0021645E27|nr:TonB-dependent receptor [Sphingomonas sp. SUN039]UVO53676.1 TonB-dependent receptor [Sphingomonas sp. SUN039]